MQGYTLPRRIIHTPAVDQFSRMSNFLGIATKFFCYILLITLICVPYVKSGKSWFSSSNTIAATVATETTAATETTEVRMNQQHSCEIMSLQDYQKFIRELRTHLKHETLTITFCRFDRVSDIFQLMNIPCENFKIFFNSLGWSIADSKINVSSDSTPNSTSSEQSLESKLKHLEINLNGVDILGGVFHEQLKNEQFISFTTKLRSDYPEIDSIISEQIKCALSFKNSPLASCTSIPAVPTNDEELAQQVNAFFKTWENLERSSKALSATNEEGEKCREIAKKCREIAKRSITSFFVTKFLNRIGDDLFHLLPEKLDSFRINISTGGMYLSDNSSLSFFQTLNENSKCKKLIFYSCYLVNNFFSFLKSQNNQLIKNDTISVRSQSLKEKNDSCFEILEELQMGFSANPFFDGKNLTLLQNLKSLKVIDFGLLPDDHITFLTELKGFMWQSNLLKISFSFYFQDSFKFEIFREAQTENFNLKIIQSASDKISQEVKDALKVLGFENENEWLSSI